MSNRRFARRDFIKTTALGVPLLAAGCLGPRRGPSTGSAPEGADGAPLQSAVKSLDLDHGWQFHEASAAGSAHPAQVPGCVHTDLLRNQLIPDPFYGTNEQKLQWIGERDWVYETSFAVPSEVLREENVELVCAGLDTYAAVTLNGAPVLTANNMFRTWRASGKEMLKETGNVLQIRFRNVFDENRPQYQAAPFRLQAFGNNDQAEAKLAMYSRKAQFHYGWDWGPRLVTAGIWRPVRLEAWSGARLRSVCVRTENVSAAGADILSIVEVESSRDQTAAIAVKLGSATLHVSEHRLAQGLTRIKLQGHLDRPDLWWTNGLGAQPLYAHRTQLLIGSKIADEHVTRIGIRSLEVVREPDADGRSFYVRLNGVPVFMKGASYVPQDNFQSRVTPARYKHIIRSAAEANMNMLRIWGGGIWEDDLCYDLCDRYGILVWQDLQFACAMYPADEAFLNNVRQEILDEVARIRNHPSLAFYCGNNEGSIAWYNWGWKPMFTAGVQSRYEADYHKLFQAVVPAALAEADPSRYYHPTSPCAGFNNIPPGEGDIHYWGVWHGQAPFEDYARNLARFVSEYGFQSYPELATVKQFAAPADRELHSPVMLAHQRCLADERRDREYGNRLIQTYLDRWYHAPKDFEAYLYVSQVMQADGVRLGMEAHRRARPYCMGSLYWQIDDCWPVASWSSIDYYGRWKALHYTVRHAYAPVLLSPVPEGDSVRFFVVSDRLEPVAAVLEIRVLNFTGGEVSRHSQPITVEPNASKSYLTLSKSELVHGADEAQLVVVSRLNTPDGLLAEHLNYLHVPKELKLSQPALAWEIRKQDGGFAVVVSCQSLAKSVRLACGDESGHFTDNYFDLLPKASKTVEFKTTLSEIEFRQKLTAISLVDSFG